MTKPKKTFSSRRGDLILVKENETKTNRKGTQTEPKPNS